MTFLHRVVGSMGVLILYHASAPDAGYAYLDPGTGSYILQMAMAAVLGGLFALKLFWKRIILYLKRLASGNKDDESQR